ncbi:unnamed protein product [Euphydryas editha]|uniref:Integrase n=1 Tax=Euphydryas editha TaxID=104508 RepID=A0AAU9TRX0_EUPED|nr:unnamed protein product [Euphydryas editha]
MKTRQSHLKYLSLFKNGGDEMDFKMLLQTFLLSNKSKSYCRKVVSTLCSALAAKNKDFVKPIFINQLINKTYRARKLWLENGETVYDSLGNRVPINWNVVAFAKEHGIDGTSSEGMLEKARYIGQKRYSLMQSKKYTGSSFDDHLCLVVLCRYFGARPKEIISLTRNGWEELAKRSYTTIDSKTGRVNLCIDSNLIEMVRKFTNDAFPFAQVRRGESFPSERFIQRVNSAYTKSLAQFKRLYKKIFNSPPPSGLGFKLFRQLVAFEAVQSGDIEIAKYMLRHKSSSMSKHYASKFGLDGAIAYAKKMTPKTLPPSTL